jgi:thiaminase
VSSATSSARSTTPSSPTSRPSTPLDDLYEHSGFAELAAWCAGPLDRVAAGLPPERVAARERAFRTNLDHELAFWDA